MADESKPQAGFLTGKKAEPKPVVAEPAAVAPPLNQGAQNTPLAGFLKRGNSTKTGVPAQQQEAPPSSNGTAAPAAVPVPPPEEQPAPPVQHAQAAPPAAEPVAGDRAQAEQLLQKGLDHYDRQETDQALTAYQECIKADPSFSLGHNNLGMVLIDLERYDDAINSLFESVRCDPTYAEAYNNLGFVLRRTQRNVEAACAYKRFLEIEPDVEEASRIQGWIGTVLKESNLNQLPPFVIPPRPGEAQAAPAAAPNKIKKMAAWEVAVNSETAAPVSALGEIIAEPETVTSPPKQQPLKTTLPTVAPGGAPAAAPVKPKSAVGAAVKPKSAVGAAVKPKSAVAPAVKPPSAVAAAVKAPAKGPVKVATKAAGVKPPGPGNQPAETGAVAKIEKGLDHFAEGELDQAAALFQQAIDEEPENAEGHTGLGKVLVRQEKFEAGIDALQKAISFAPDDPAAYYVLGFALRAVERNIEASESYEKFLELMPDAVETTKMRQWIIHVKGAASVGIVEDNTFVEEEDLNTETDQKYKGALQRFKDGDIDHTLRESVRILNEDPAHYRTRVLLGRIFMRQKQYDNAVEQLEGALVTRPDYPEALYFLAQAAEKRGSMDQATQNYKRYIEVSPDGPRAERINEWLKMNNALVDTASQVQCELCLRFFPGSDVSQHDGKTTCRNCLSVMGAAPSSMEAPLDTLQRAIADADAMEGKGPSKLKIFFGLAALLAIAVGAMVYLGKLDGVLIRLGLKKRPPVQQQGPIIPVGPKIERPDPISTAAISGEPQLQVLPFTHWSFTPKLTGAESLDNNPVAKGWKKELTLKSGPKGMAVDPDGNSIIWAPTPSDWDVLKSGETYSAEIAIRGTWTGPDGKVTELFAVAKPFTLSMQFGYDLSSEIDLGITNPGEQIVLASGDLNGDGIADLIVGAGQFRRGSLRLHINRGRGQFASPTTLATGGRFSGIWVGDLDGDRNDDVLVANWQNGKLTPWYREGMQPTAGAAFDLGPGTIALAVGKMEEGRSVHIAALQGVNHSLAITWLAPDRKFGDLTRVPMPSGGSHGWVFPWNSAQVGTGFLAVVPLAESPLQLVTYNRGAWNKGGGTIQSGIGDVGLISAAAPISSGPGKAQRLAVVVTKTDKTSYLMLMEERAGSFAPVGTKTQLSGPGLGLLARDFNQDGQDDLMVLTLEECSIYFCDSQTGELRPGPTYKTPRMRGQCVPMNVGNVNRPDILLLDESAKAYVLRPSEAK